MTAALLTALALAASPGSLTAPQTWDFPVGAAPQVELGNVSGPITVTGAAGEKAHLEARWEGGSQAEQARWRVEVEGGKGHLRARVCCGPCAHPERRCPEAVRVALTAVVPQASRLELSEVSGEASVRGVQGDLALHSVSGGLRAEGSQGALSVETVDGAVTLLPARLEQARLHAVGGHFQLTLPPGTGAEVRFHAVGGRLNGRSVALGDARERIGAGGASVECNVVGGALDIR